MRKLLFFVAIVTVFVANSGLVLASDPDLFFKRVTNAGREFFVTFPTCVQAEEPSPEDVCRLTMIGDKEQLVTVRIPGKDYEEQRLLQPYVSTHWDFSPELAQPYQFTSESSSVTDSIFEAAAMHILAESQVVVHVESRFGSKRSSFIALPADFLCPTNGFASYQFQSLAVSRDSVRDLQLPSQMYFVAIEDDTEIWLRVPNITKNSQGQESIVYTEKRKVLNSGDVYCFSPSAHSPRLSGMGTYLSSRSINQRKPYAVFASEYKANPIDSTEVDFATLQFEPGVEDNNTEHREALYSQIDVDVRCVIYDTVSGYSKFLAKTDSMSFEYHFPSKNFVQLLNESFAFVGTTIGEKTVVEPTFSHTLSAYPNGSHVLPGTTFYVSDIQGDSTEVVLIVYKSQSEESALVLSQLEPDHESWSEVEAFEIERLTATSVNNFYSVSITLAPGVYSAAGLRHCVFTSYGQPLARTKQQAGGFEGYPEYSYSRKGNSIVGSIIFASIPSSRVILSDFSENCEVLTTHHDYGKDIINFNVSLIDTTRHGIAFIEAHSLSGWGESDKVRVVFYPCNPDSEFLLPIPNKNIHEKIAPLARVTRTVNFEFANPGLNTLEDIHLEGSDQILLREVDIDYNNNNGFIEIESRAQIDTGQISAIVSGTSHCGDVVELANIVIDIVRGHLFAYELDSMSTIVKGWENSTLRLQNTGQIDVNIRRVELIDSNNVFTRSNLQGLIDGKLPPTDVASLIIAFRPVTTGTFHAELQVVSNAYNDTLKIPLVGHGRAKPNSVEQQLNAIGVQAHVLPHPATENSQLHIHSSVARSVEVSFVNTLGQTVANSVTEHYNEHTVDIPSSLAPGLWHAVLRIEGQQYSVPFVVE